MPRNLDSRSELPGQDEHVLSVLLLDPARRCTHAVSWAVTEPERLARWIGSYTAQFD